MAPTWRVPAVTFESGQNYIYPLTIRKTGIDAGTPIITDWQTNDHGTGTTVELKDFVRIPAGTFLMGSPEDESGRQSDEKQHWVTLSKDFYMSKYQVTNAQYAAFLNAKHAEGVLEYGTAGGYTDAAYLMGSTDEPLVRDCNSMSKWGITRNSSDGTWSPVSGYEKHPVIYVTWYGAKAYADYYGYNLLTEAQWEYACRAGTTTVYSYGDTADGDYMWYAENNSPDGTKAVGTKLPNPWGLYDMHGNVYEWCSDHYATYADAPTEDVALVDPEYISDNTGSYRVLRGGDWSGYAQNCHSAHRPYAAPPRQRQQQLRVPCGVRPLVAFGFLLAAGRVQASLFLPSLRSIGSSGGPLNKQNRDVRALSARASPVLAAINTDDACPRRFFAETGPEVWRQRISFPTKVIYVSCGASKLSKLRASGGRRDDRSRLLPDSMKKALRLQGLLLCFAGISVGGGDVQLLQDAFEFADVRGKVALRGMLRCAM